MILPVLVLVRELGTSCIFVNDFQLFLYAAFHRAHHSDQSTRQVVAEKLLVK